MAGKIDYIMKETSGSNDKITWKAFDMIGNCISSAKSKNECMKAVREQGYVIPAKVINNVKILI